MEVMYKLNSPRARLAFLSILGASFVLASSAKAVLVTWQLNPQGLEGDVGSNSVTLTQSGYSIIARSFNANGSAVNLFNKNEGFDELGLGVVSTAHHEIEAFNGAPAQFIQLDLTSLFAAGNITNGKIQVASVQGSSNDTFTIYGSNTAGILGTQIGSVYTSADDQVFLTIPQFGVYKYYSIGALSGDVLPEAFQANCTPIPEMSALLPILGLFSAIGASRLLRRRA
jgi:hypothetical protein